MGKSNYKVFLSKSLRLRYRKYFNWKFPLICNRFSNKFLNLITWLQNASLEAGSWPHFSTSQTLKLLPMGTLSGNSKSSVQSRFKNIYLFSSHNGSEHLNPFPLTHLPTHPTVKVPNFQIWTGNEYKSIVRMFSIGSWPHRKITSPKDNKIARKCKLKTSS